MSAESLRVPPARPPSCISMLAERLKRSNLQDTKTASSSGGDGSPYDIGSLATDTVDAVPNSTRFLRRPKAVNFNCDEACNIPVPSHHLQQQCSSATSSDVEGSPVTCDSGNEDSSESWTGGGAFSLSSSSRAPGGIDAFFYNQTLQHCLSTSAPDGGAGLLFPAASDISPGSERKSFCFCRHYHQAQKLQSCFDEVDADASFLRQPPPKRSCRSQSASSSQKLTTSASSSSRKVIARPIALRVSQRSLYSPAGSVGASSSAFASAAAHALVASGFVKLRNPSNTGLNSATSRLSWHHPSSCGSSGSAIGVASRRMGMHAGGASRHSVIFGGGVSDLAGEVRLRKPPSLACIASSANVADLSHHRLSAFTPTTQSRRMSLICDDEGNAISPLPSQVPAAAAAATATGVAAGVFFFSPDTSVSSPSGAAAPAPPAPVLQHPRPSVSAASSGFFQDSCSLFSHSSCCCSSSTNSEPTNPGPQPPTFGGIQVGRCPAASKPMAHFDDSTTSLSILEHQHQHQLHPHPHHCHLHQQNCEAAAKLRCQSQPAGAGGGVQTLSCACGMASTECLSRLAGLKRRRCSQDVGFFWEAESTNCGPGGGVFLFGSHHQVIGGSFEGPTTFNLDVVEQQELHSVSPLCLQQQAAAASTSELPAAVSAVFPQDPESVAFLMSCRRKELSGLSEASEEEESNESAQLHCQQSCCVTGAATATLEEYDAGTLTPPPQTRFRPIAPSPGSEEDESDVDCQDKEGDGASVSQQHHSCSTEGSPVSFKVGSSGNVVGIFSEEEEVDLEDAFGGIAPGLSHRERRFSPMQTEGEPEEKFSELDIDMIEQD